jgi:NRPS condensation-like uncharacterized protein
VDNRCSLALASMESDERRSEMDRCCFSQCPNSAIETSRAALISEADRPNSTEGVRMIATPLNCVDKALLALHSKDEPMVFHMILTIDEVVDPVRLKSALMTVLHRHPSLRSTIHTGPFAQVREAQNKCDDEILTLWDLAAPEDLIGVDQSHIGAWYRRRLSEWMNRPLDPSRVLPCRVLILRKTLKEFSLVFTFHHSAADGLHAFRFINEVIQDYNGVSESASPSTSSLIEVRGDELVALAQARRLKVKHFYLRIIASLAHRFLFAPLSPSARICRTSSKRSAETYFCQGSLNPHEVGQIRSRSRSIGATVNDVLLAGCFRTIEQWNEVCGKRSRKISIMVPVDVSNASPSPGSANQVSFISVSTTRKERSDLDHLLRTVNRRTTHMLRDGIAFSIVYAVHFCTHLHPAIPKAAAKFLMVTQTYLDSILVTNVGVIWPGESASREGVTIGDAKITSIVGLAPVVSPMGISLCVGTYDGHLRIALSYKTSQFSETQARTFLNLYLHELRSYQRTVEGVLVPEVTQRDTREPVSVK